MAKAAAKKSARKSAGVVARRRQAAPPGRPFVPGPDPRRGRGPAKGAENAGRPPIGLRRLAKSILRDEKAQAELLAAARDRTTHGYSAVIRTLFAYAVGMPKQQVEVSGPNGGPQQHEHTHRQTWVVGGRELSWN